MNIFPWWMFWKSLKSTGNKQGVETTKDGPGRVCWRMGWAEGLSTWVIQLCLGDPAGEYLGQSSQS